MRRDRIYPGLEREAAAVQIFELGAVLAVVDTIGAGDSYLTVLIHGLLTR